VRVGDRLRVRPGDAIPVDGAVLDGSSNVDESVVTGESMPVEKHPGDKLIGGTINGTGSLVMCAEKVGSETMLARIVAMVAEAQRSRAPIQRLADTVSSWFVPAVIAIAGNLRVRNAGKSLLARLQALEFRKVPVFLQEVGKQIKQAHRYRSPGEARLRALPRFRQHLSLRPS